MNRSPLRRKIFIHIGTHKTGTTSIQNFLRTHADELRADGIFVPSSGTVDTRSGHHNVAWQLRADVRRANAASGVPELIEELRSAGESTAIISSEGFEYLSQHPQRLKAFDDQLQEVGYETRYMVSFRNPEDYAASLYTELITHHGLTEDFETFARPIRDTGSVTLNGDWFFEFRADRFVERWQSIVGPKLIVSNYDDVVAGAGVLPCFLETIGASRRLIDLSRNAPVLNTRRNTMPPESSARSKVAEDPAPATAAYADLRSRGERSTVQRGEEQAGEDHREAELARISEHAAAITAEFHKEHAQRLTLEVQLAEEQARRWSAESQLEAERLRFAALDGLFRASTSWRVTAPLRKVSQAIAILLGRFAGDARS